MSISNTSSTLWIITFYKWAQIVNVLFQKKVKKKTVRFSPHRSTWSHCRWWCRTCCIIRRDDEDMDWGRPWEANSSQVLTATWVHWVKMSKNPNKICNFCLSQNPQNSIPILEESNMCYHEDENTKSDLIRISLYIKLDMKVAWWDLPPTPPSDDFF